LKQKVNAPSTMNKFSGVSNVLGGLNEKTNVPNTSHNYRKVFKPNLGGNDNEAINKMSGQTLSSTGGLGSKTNSNNKFNYNSGNGKTNTVESRINKNSINPNFNQPSFKKPASNNRFRPAVEEVEDDRPAFAQGSSNEPEIDDVGDLQECGGCGRRFREEALAKHAKACKKVFQSKRKAFDMKKKRILDSEHAMILKQAEVEEKHNPKLKQVKAKKKENWKKQSEMIRNVAAANRTDSDFNKQGPGSKQQQAASKNYDSDLNPCGSCGRKFNDEAIKKHKVLCERKERENKMKGKSNVNSNVNSKPINKFGKK